MTQTLHTDVLIIGAGIAGLMTAFHINSGKRIILISAEQSSESSSSYAQGGIAAVSQRIFNADTPEAQNRHIQDTLKTGYDLCRADVVETVVREADQAIETLLSLQVPFSKKDARFHQGLEGGHSERRIWHVADYTGKSITTALHRHITVQAHICTIDNHHLKHILTTDHDEVHGALFIDATTGEQLCVYASEVVLATGGASSVYQYASGSPLSRGEGIAAAYDVGATITNMEFVQFHPTYYLDAHTGKGFLLSEALRGEGAKLLDEHQRPFLHKFGGQELITREKCAYAIYQQLQQQQYQRVLLDMRHCDSRLLQSSFPHIHAQCQQVGLDLGTDSIPVTPVAHYTCGGIDVDIDGRSSVAHLYAVGEVAHTGLHGANRLASNSLLECLTFAKRIGDAVNSAPTPANTQPNIYCDTAPIPTHQHNWHALLHRLQEKMWHDVAIVRNATNLRSVEAYIELEQADKRAYADSADVNAIHYTHMLTTCKLIVQSALLRTESRGLHHITDFPHTDSHASHSYLTKEH